MPRDVFENYYAEHGDEDSAEDKIILAGADKAAGQIEALASKGEIFAGRNWRRAGAGRATKGRRFIHRRRSFTMPRIGFLPESPNLRGRNYVPENAQ